MTWRKTLFETKPCYYISGVVRSFFHKKHTRVARRIVSYENPRRNCGNVCLIPSAGRSGDVHRASCLSNITDGVDDVNVTFVFRKNTTQVFRPAHRYAPATPPRPICFWVTRWTLLAAAGIVPKIHLQRRYITRSSVSIIVRSEREYDGVT